MRRMIADPFGLLDDAFHDDPYASYARMREEAPVHFSEAWGAWLLVRHADVGAAFRDRRFSAKRSSAFAAQLPDEVRQRLEPLRRNLASWALLLDPPEHTRIRGLVNRAFTPRVVEAMRPRIADLARELVRDAFAEAETVDVVAAVATPLPVLVIGELLGLPREDRGLLKAWSDAIAAFLGAVRPDEARIAGAARGVVELEAYFRDALAARRRAPTDDLLSALCRAEDAGILLSDQEVVSTCSMLLFGGHETTTNLIAGGLYSLLRHPSELARLRAAPETIGGAVEELLRFEAPVQRMGRLLAEDVELGGAQLRAGDRAFLVIAAANRDPRVFRDADKLDVARAEPRHFSFGLGAHYCVGAALGRMEAEHALVELARRPMELAEKPAWLRNATLRGLESLRVRQHGTQTV